MHHLFVVLMDLKERRLFFSSVQYTVDYDQELLRAIISPRPYKTEKLLSLCFVFFSLFDESPLSHHELLDYVWWTVDWI